jgi:hypothetical protein
MLAALAALPALAGAFTGALAVALAAGLVKDQMTTREGGSE